MTEILTSLSHFAGELSSVYQDNFFIESSNVSPAGGASTTLFGHNFSTRRDIKIPCRKKRFSLCEVASRQVAVVEWRFGGELGRLHINTERDMTVIGRSED